jgi:hypothetical protein
MEKQDLHVHQMDLLQLLHQHLLRLLHQHLLPDWLSCQLLLAVQPVAPVLLLPNPCLLGLRRSCCGCLTCAILVKCRLMLTLLFEICHIVKIVVVIVATWKIHTLLCNLTRLPFRFPWVSFPLVI